jgi:hypothetical protein
MINAWVVPHKELPNSPAVWRFLTQRLLFPEMRSQRAAGGEKPAGSVDGGSEIGADQVRISVRDDPYSYPTGQITEARRILMLEQTELARMEAFLFFADKARAACSALLQRAAVREAMKCDDSVIRIERNSHVILPSFLISCPCA